MSGLQVITKNKTLSDQAYEVIKNAIITNKLKPGEILAEEKLAKQLTISRTPIKAALTRLVYEKMAVVNENKNIVVVDITKKEVEDITLVRRYVEELGIELLEGKMNLKRVKILEDLYKHYEEMIEKGDIEAMLESDYKFHTTLAAFTGNKFLLGTICEANMIVKRYLMLSGTFIKHSVQANEEHKMIIEYLRKGEFIRAKKAMGMHLEKVSQRMLQN